MRSGKSPTDFRDEVAGDAITLPEFWSANGACAFVLKSSRPSLPLKKAPPLISVFFNGHYTPFGSPVWGTETSGKKRKTALLGARTATLYSWRGIKALRHVVRDGTAMGGKAICKYLNFLIWIEVLKETGSSLL